MRMSPTEKTFAQGIQLGAAHRATSQERCGEASSALFRFFVKCSPAPRSAEGRAGMWPPLARIAARLDTSPAAISGMPGIRALRATADAKRAYEMSHRTTDRKSVV